METRTVELDTPDGAMPVYEAIPDDPRAAVLVIQEVFGVTDHIEDVTRRAAEAGFHAVAPHLFHRTGSPQLPYDDFSAVMPHMQELTDERVLADVDATIAHLTGSGWGTPQIGLVGFCFGGRISFLVATARPLGAVVGFYGGGIVTARFPQFPSLIDRAADLKAPWLGLFGSDDQSISLDDVETIRTELGANTPVAHDVVVYEGAGHGFHCDARPQHFDEHAAKEAWTRTLGWFDTHLARRGGN
ncbi:MAG TPA: dienelactone hydrolase family protein [Acidimicrobiales bacterium]|jgi:carboxymethylenebutenolidase|nr:dienelactone hydrolase family protein [Acidimicrobiales bacterium]